MGNTYDRVVRVITGRPSDEGDLDLVIDRKSKINKESKVEACEDGDDLKIKTEEAEKINEDNLDFQNFGDKAKVVNNIKKWIDKKNLSASQIKQEFKDQKTAYEESWLFNMAYNLGFTDNPYEWYLGDDECDFIEKTFNDYLKSKMNSAPKDDGIIKLIKYILDLDQDGLDIQDMANKLRKNKKFEIKVH